MTAQLSTQIKFLEEANLQEKRAKTRQEESITKGARENWETAVNRSQSREGKVKGESAERAHISRKELLRRGIRK